MAYQVTYDYEAINDKFGPFKSTMEKPWWQGFRKQLKIVSQAPKSEHMLDGSVSNISFNSVQRFCFRFLFELIDMNEGAIM